MRLLVRAIAAFLFLAASAGVARAIDFTQFHTPDEIDTEMNNLAAAHPTLAATFTYGISVEGRPLRGLKISDNVATDESDEGDVVFVGLHHAREWISAEMALYLAEYLVTNYASDPALKQCMDNLEIWVVPVVNPDGYQYTTTPGNRFWRKNRVNNGDGTFGVDLNRNYEFQFGFGSGAQGSDNTWEDTYRGPSPFSEPETLALRDFVHGLDDPRLLISYHSYSELFLRPWAYTTMDPPGEPTLAFLANDSIARIAGVHGHIYQDSIWYVAYGETTDYFWSENRIAGFTPELRPASSGGGGFAPPPSEIIPNNEENLTAALAFIRDAGCRRVWIKDHAADTGAEPSAVWTGSGWSHPFWTSPDIWTDPAGPLVEGSTVTLHVRVHNDSPAALTNSVVRAYYTDPRIVLEFPGDNSVLIGEQTLTLPPGDTVVTFPWTVPMGTNSWGEWHWCVGAIITHADDRPLTTEIQRSNNIGGKNFQTQEMVGRTAGMLVGATNELEVAAEFVAQVDPEQIPRGWRVILPTISNREKPNRKAALLGVKGTVLEPGETILQPVRIIAPETAPSGTEVTIEVEGALIPLVAGKRVPVGNGYSITVRVP